MFFFLNKNKSYILFGLIIHIIWLKDVSNTSILLENNIKIFIKLDLINEYLKLR
jgi:hypothetical protein